MMINYEPLWELLDVKKIKKTQLRTEAGLSSSTLAKLGKNQPVALSVLVKICNVLHCQLSEICYVIEREERGDGFE